jgi:hypothetical protein
MAPWDATKTTEDGDGTVDSDEQLTADEWNTHVTDGHFPSDTLNFGTDGNGLPVVTDSANGDQVVWRYDPGGGQWEVVNVDLSVNSNDIQNAGSVETGGLQHTEVTGESGSLYAALSQGLIVASGVDGFKIVNPDDSSSESDAIASANQYILNSSENEGDIYLPVTKPSGGRFTISSQVQLGSTSAEAAVSVHAPLSGETVRNSYSGSVFIDIDNGNTAFVISSDLTGTAGRQVAVTGAYRGSENNNGLVRLQNINDFAVDASMSGHSGSAILLDGVANGYIDGNYHPLDANARIVDSRAGHQAEDSDFVLAPTMETESQYDSLLTDVDASSTGIARARVSGHHEGGQGDAMIDVQDGALIVDSNLHLVGSGAGTHGIRHQGGSWVDVCGGSIFNVEDALRFEGTMDWLDISTSVSFNKFNTSGDSIFIANDPSGVSTVPESAAVRGTVTYPSGTSNLRAIQTATI